MHDTANLSAKLEQVKKRISRALAEYAINWEAMQGTFDRSDLTGFLSVWNEEFAKLLKEPVQKDIFFQLANLLNNLEIQLDMLRGKKNWQTVSEDSTTSTGELPPELETIRKTVDATTN